MKRAFTIFDVLVVAFLVMLVLSVFLYPVFAQASICGPPLVATNMKKVAEAALLYVDDNGGAFPLAFGTDGNRHLWRHGALVPSEPAAFEVRFTVRARASAATWPNSLTMYGLDYEHLRAIDPEYVDAPIPVDRRLPVTTASRIPIGFTYNGLLHGYPVAAVAKPDRLPLFWPGLGFHETYNVALSSPVLACDQPLPAPCTYAPATVGCSQYVNGASSRLLTPQARMWSLIRVRYYAYSDGSASFENDGGWVAEPDETTEPFTDYDENDVPRSFWWDGCHPWLFRPDYDFE